MRLRTAPSVAAGAALLAWMVLFPGTAAAQATFYEAWDAGLAHEAAGEWRQARESFQRAAALHPEPARRVKAYGLNFIERYDPYAHLARAAVRLGLLDEAARHLDRARAARVTGEAELGTLADELGAARAKQASPTPPGRTERPPETAPPAAAARPIEELARPDEKAARPQPPIRAPEQVSEPPARPVAVPTVPPGAAIVARGTGREGRSGAVAEPPVQPSLRPTASPSDAGPAAPEVRATAATPVPTAPATGPSPAAPSGPSARDAGRPPTASPAAPAGYLIAGGVALLVLGAGAAALFLRRKRLPDAPAPAQANTETRLMEVSRGDARREASHAGSGAASLSAAEPVAASPRPGSSQPFGDYVLEGLLGRGSMGTTHVARRTRDGFEVAIKIPHEHVTDQPDFVARFLREGALGATLRHPNIVRIYEAGEHAGRPFIAMEFLRGETLEALLRREKLLPLERALQVARGIALALDYAHLKGIVHRDLKPDNVMVLADGSVKVMDYGIARRMGETGLTSTDMYLGTPLYSSPESLRPTEIDPQSDLYSLGIILFRMLTGAFPFFAASPLELLRKHASEPLPPFPAELGLAPGVFELVVRLTAKAKADRYGSAELFLRDLDPILNRL